MLLIICKQFIPIIGKCFKGYVCEKREINILRLVNNQCYITNLTLQPDSNLQWNDGNGWMGSSLRFRGNAGSNPDKVHSALDRNKTTFIHTHPTFVISYTWSLSIKHVITKWKFASLTLAYDIHLHCITKEPVVVFICSFLFSS